MAPTHDHNAEQKRPSTGKTLWLAEIESVKMVLELTCLDLDFPARKMYGNGPNSEFKFPFFDTETERRQEHKINLKYPFFLR